MLLNETRIGNLNKNIKKTMHYKYLYYIGSTSVRINSIVNKLCRNCTRFTRSLILADNTCSATRLK